MVFVVLRSRVGNFECVNAGSGVIMFHHQPWVAEIGNEANTFVKLKNRKRKDDIRTSVRFEKLEDKRGLYRFLLPLTATTRAPSSGWCRLWARQRWECVCSRRGPQVDRY
jgi:hypothetical protein